MALGFGKKRTDEESGEVRVDFEPQPLKAGKWFKHARAAADGSQFDYALHNYAQGIRLDPTDQQAHEEMFDVARKYAGQGGKAARGSDLRKLEGNHPVEKFTAAEFAWMKDLKSASLALKFLEASVKAMIWAGDIGRWHAARVINVIRNQKKPSKSQLVQAKDLLSDLGAWDEAVAAGQAALQIDPNDMSLQGEINNLTVQRAMDQAGYADAAGEEGGFKHLVLDMDKQRELEDAEAISGNLSIDERNLQRAKDEYEKTPEVPDVINRYAQLLKARATPESEELAHEIAIKGYGETGQYRFRAFAGDIRLEQQARKVLSLRKELESNGADPELKSEYEKRRTTLLELKRAEFGERVKEYPTDRALKHRLGEVEFERGDFDEAIAYFQEARDEPRFRVRAGYMLGRCFAAENYHMEAIEEYNDALGGVEAGDKSTELSIRYDLMVSLMAHARAERSLELAKEALGICSTIARKDIRYRNIRDCRREVDTLVRELSGRGSGDEG